jgi:hypothetical protein
MDHLCAVLGPSGSLLGGHSVSTRKQGGWECCGCIGSGGFFYFYGSKASSSFFIVPQTQPEAPRTRHLSGVAQASESLPLAVTSPRVLELEPCIIIVLG